MGNILTEGMGKVLDVYRLEAHLAFGSVDLIRGLFPAERADSSGLG
jgi:hypothetical protein